MGTIKGLYRKVQALNVDVVIENVFVSNETVIADENKKQLFEGYTKEQTRLRPYKNAAYARKKFALNPIPGPGNPDFFVTGHFFKQWQVRIDGDVIRNILNDPKSVFLMNRDPDIIGLGGPYRTELIGILRSQIAAGLRQKIFT